MSYFRKYSFPNEGIAKDICSKFANVVYIGHIPLTYEVQLIDGIETKLPTSYSDDYCVDILWDNEIDNTINQYMVWPKPVGIHTFFGCDKQYELDYKKYSK